MNTTAQGSSRNLAPAQQAAPVPAPAGSALLYDAQVRHVRAAKQRYALKHRTYYWLVDIDQLPRPPAALRPLAGFRAADHFDGRGSTLREGLERFLAGQGAATPQGRVLMLTQARVLGYVFNPLTVYWCHDRQGVLQHVVAEVHNTYGARHAYLLGPEAVTRAEADKAFYVSPFLPVAGRYRMRLPLPASRLDLTVHLDLDDSRAFTATVKGTARPATAGNLVVAALRHPLAPLVAALAIRFHGIRLYLRRLPVVPRPSHQAQKGMK